MKSTIKVDFRSLEDKINGFEPVIKVVLEDSEDVRDSLLKSFFQSLGGDSSWLRVNYENRVSIDENDKKTYVTLSPVKWTELEKEEEIIRLRIDNKANLFK